MDVSIHTPAWGVTIMRIRIFLISKVSIHTPAWGVTFVHFGNVVPSCFNPHSRMGSDLSESGLPEETLCFNPHSRMGSDRVISIHLIFSP